MRESKLDLRREAMTVDEKSPLPGTVSVGRVWGVPVRVHWSVLGIVGLIAFVLATDELPALHPGEARATYWLLAIAMAGVFFASIALHEMAHAVVARRFGVEVKEMTLWLFGGLTELRGEPPSPRAQGWIAGAGPLCTLLLSAFFGAGAYGLGDRTLFGIAFGWLMVTGVILALFNLLPAAPLDGARLLRAAVWGATKDRAKADEVVLASSRFIGFLMVGLGLATALAGAMGGLWLALIGWFVIGSAATEQRVGRLSELEGLSAADAMTPAPVSVPSWWTVSTLLQQLSAEITRQPAFPVVDVDGLALGAITLADLERVPAEQAQSLRLDKVLARHAPKPLVPVDAPLLDVARALTRGAPVAVVVDELGRAVGLVDAAVLDRAARLAHLMK